MNVWTVDRDITVVVTDFKNRVMNVRKAIIALKEAKPMFLLLLVMSVLLVIIVQKAVLTQCPARRVSNFIRNYIFVVE